MAGGSRDPLSVNNMENLFFYPNTMLHSETFTFPQHHLLGENDRSY